MRALWLLCLPALAGAQGLREIDLRVASEAAGPQGLAVRVALPPKPRYEAGAPVVVHVAGGWGAGDLAGAMAPLAPLGFIEVRFVFPGNARGSYQSGGLDDARGPRSLLALADVVAFATGAAKALDGRSLAEISAPIAPQPGNAGLLGWSNGGNQAVLVLARHSRKVQGVGWVVTWESPIGDGAATALAGDHRSGLNPAYDLNTGAVDYSRLRYGPDLPIAMFGGALGPPGAFYLDLNGSGRPDEGDVVPSALPVPGAGRPLFAYPRSLVEAAAQRQLVPGWPVHLLPAGQIGEFWRDRDAAGSFVQARINREPLLAMVLGTERDHVQAAPDHPHIHAAYQGWLSARLSFVRLNPDRAYLAALTGAAAIGAPETPANTPLERLDLPPHLIPEGLLPDALLAAAAACELADRVATGNRDPDLAAVLAPTELPRPPARGEQGGFTAPQNPRPGPGRQLGSGSSGPARGAFRRG